ncbi:hypothetical protein SAMN05216184_101187 [Georgenia satyanarayanai]|uniref:DUF1440 domain-containing protein n=1 Tax=Georgenia satyanarayanai TaxID=860221 RepID=A0A2Y9C2R0_9MICO|nr:DUF1440 domain-containing protein [Georgenia satyanarayanai]PYG01723.1 hypothetical protein A8987_101187 [Georgenia satyanarayanai]SSA36523.1 hypothetical protein SAMN05216184_101187 [Georgenia satyanarayanai]
MRTDLVQDAAATVVAGVGASWVMNRATTAFQARQSAESRRREEEASSDVAYAALVQQAAALVGGRLDPGTAERLGLAFHYAMGTALVPGYVLLRRRLGLRPVPAGLVLGLSVSVVVDEVANPLVGSAAPPGDYPLASHLRGLVGHVAFGLAVPVLFEATTALLRRLSRP